MAETYQKIGTSTLLRTFANDPPPNAIIQPPDSVYAAGMVVVDTPLAQWITAIYKDFGEKINHGLQHGIPRWNNATDYTVGDLATDAGSAWLAVSNNTNSQPTISNPAWVKVATGKGITGSMSAAHGVDVALTTTGTAVPFGTNLYDSAGSIDHDISTNNTRFVVNKAGDYNIRFKANVAAVAAPTGGGYLWLAKNGTTIANTAAAFRMSANNSRQTVIVEATVPLVATDYIELFAIADVNSEYTLDNTAASGTRPAVPSVTAELTGWA